ncbi:MAG: winged helix-turn-helix domain-containing protein, partial [Chloroflexi bacterium]|nr:winged helix-turn-helix domain-containing protein [Chloroflexota bacterium]
SFWHWMDRFYYEVYHPWRLQRQNLLEAQTRRALTVLGVKEKRNAIPEISWLPEMNPLLRYPEVKSAVQAGQIGVYFWLEPFGLADSWWVAPGLVIVSFAEPGKIYENYYSFARSLASRTQALADPTRLVILRMIRNIGMTNTDMAKYLGISRPTVSIHARILREAGLIRSLQRGREVRHEILPDEVHRVFHDLEHFLDLPPEEKDKG